METKRQRTFAPMNAVLRELPTYLKRKCNADLEREDDPDAISHHFYRVYLRVMIKDHNGIPLRTSDSVECLTCLRKAVTDEIIGTCASLRTDLNRHFGVCIPYDSIIRGISSLKNRVVCRDRFVTVTMVMNREKDRIEKFGISDDDKVSCLSFSF